MSSWRGPRGLGRRPKPSPQAGTGLRSFADSWRRTACRMSPRSPWQSTSPAPWFSASWNSCGRP
eukprot:4505086-Lingulodinium_polyedra.AAC.1